MDVNVEQLGPVKKKINVAIPPEKVAEEIASTYHKLKQTVKIRGFRPGKVPQDLLKKYYKDEVEGEVISRLIQGSYPEALKQLQIVPVSQPVVENGVLEEGKEFLYSASFEVKPKIELKEYLNLPVEKETFEVTQKDVENRLAMIRESHASLKEIEEDRPITTGDFIVADIEGTIQEKPFEGGDVKDYLLEVGSDSYLPGLSQKLIGLRKDTSEEILLAIPEDYRQRDLAGKEVRLKIKIKGLKEKVLPALDDSFARDLGENQGFESFKNKLKNDLEKEEKRRIESLVRNNIVDQLIEKNPLEVPTFMVERQIEFMMADTQRALLAQGSSLEQLGVPLENIKESYRKDAEKQVKCSLFVEVIAKNESIAVSDEEVEEKIKEIAVSNNQDVAKVRAFYRKEGLWEGLKVKLLEQKTLDFLLEKATITEVDKKENS
jgi:trigger factor